MCPEDTGGTGCPTRDVTAWDPDRNSVLSSVTSAERILLLSVFPQRLSSEASRRSRSAFLQDSRGESSHAPGLCVVGRRSRRKGETRVAEVLRRF